jgi:hypothetical protein
MNYLSPWYERFAQSLIWAAVVWTALQLTIVQGSFVGAPDVYGLQSVLRLQKNLVSGDAAPVVLIDFSDEDWAFAAARRPPSDTPAPPEPPPLYVPRYALGETLDFLSKSGAVAVFVDVDTSFVPPANADRAYADAIARWRALPDAPLLAIARTDWEQPSLFERNGMPAPAPGENVVEGTVRIFADQERIVDNVEFWSCEGPRGAQTPRASVAVYLAAAARFDSGRKGRAAVDAALANIRCDDAKARLVVGVPGDDLIFPARDGPIHYHLGLKETADGAWVSERWPSTALRPAPASRCRNDTLPVAGLLRVSDILAGMDSGGVSDSLVCGAMVVVGSTSRVVRDVHPSPYGDMPGAFILANAARGLDLTGPLRRYPYWAGLAVVAAICAIVFLAHEGIHRWSHAILIRKPRSRRGAAFRWAVSKVTHPLTLSLVITNLLFVVGIAATFVMIKDGYWGVFAASVLAASLSNAFDDVEAMRRVLLEPVESPTTG